MNITTANQAAAIAPQYTALQNIIAAVQKAISEHWLVSTVVVVAPETGSTSPAGTSLSLVAPGTLLDDANSQLTMTTALSIYQAQLVALQTQLDAL